MYENVKFSTEAREKLIEGAALVANAVATTFGPNGHNVAIQTPSGVKVTKDGATVALHVNDTDPYVNMGIQLMRDISTKTADVAGDGSTTAAILANAIIEQFKNCPSSLDFFDQYSILDKLKEYIQPYTEERLIQVATISANNNSEIGTLVGNAFNTVGIDGLVTIEESENVKDKVVYSSGFRIDSGYDSPYFINTSKSECVLDNVLVHISETKLDESKEIQSLAGRAYKERKSLLLLAPEFDSGLTLFLARNMYNTDGTPRLKSCTVVSPNFGTLRSTMLDDIRILLGESMMCEKVVITKDTTTFIGNHSDKDKINARVDSIRAILKDSELPELELNFHKKRLANFVSGMATIYVGGYSKVQMKERYDLIEDAVRATQCALEGGILAGGGLVLRDIAKTISNTKIKEVLLTPYKKLNLLSEDFTQDDAIRFGIVEPYLVVKTALENAINLAKTILTCDCAILNV